MTITLSRKYNRNALVKAFQVTGILSFLHRDATARRSTITSELHSIDGRGRTEVMTLAYDDTGIHHAFLQRAEEAHFKAVVPNLSSPGHFYS